MKLTDRLEPTRGPFAQHNPTPDESFSRTLNVTYERPLVGILGGMGPRATADFLYKLTANTPAQSESDHLQTIIWSDPRIPDRTLAILGIGPSPVPAMTRGVRALQSLGAELIAMPCNTAHAFLEDVRQATGAIVVDMIEASMGEVATNYPEAKTVGVLCTSGTRIARLYDEVAADNDLACVYLSESDQASLLDVSIREVKINAELSAAQERIRKAAALLTSAGADVLVAACSEISILVQGLDGTVPWIDSTDCLARATVNAAHDCSSAPR